MTRLSVPLPSRFRPGAALLDALLVLAFALAALMVARHVDAFEWLSAMLAAYGQADEMVVAVMALCGGSLYFGARRWRELARAYDALHEAGEALRDRELRVRTLVEHASEAIVVAGADGRIEDVNHAAATLLGHAGEALVGRPLETLVAPADLARTPLRMAELRAGHAVRSERRLLRADGAEVPVEVGARMMLDGRVLAIVRDVSERERAAAELRDRERRLRMVTGQLPAVVWTTDTLPRFTSALGSGLRELGLDPQECVGQPLAAYFGDDPSHPSLHAHQLALDGHSHSYTMEFGGRVFASHVEPLTGEDGRRVGVIGVALDETGRAEAERALRTAEAHYRRLVEHSPYGIYVTDSERCCVEANAAMERILGRSFEEMRGRSFFEVVEEAETLRRVIGMRQQGDTGVVEFEVTVVHPGGQRRRVHVTSSTVVENGEITGTFGMVRDVTEERAGAARLRELSAALELAVEGIAWLDEGGAVAEANPAFAATFGLAPQELAGTPWKSLVHADDFGLAREARERMRVAGRAGLLCRGVRADGAVVQLEAVLVAQRDADGVLAGHHCFLRDVTERRRLEDQLRHSQKMEAVGRLAGGVAHDFNNLLTAIKGYADLVADELPAGSGLRDDVDEIRAAAVRAAGLTRQLLAFSLRQVLQPRMLDLNAVVTSVEKMLRRLIGEDVELVNRLAPAVGPVWADPGQLDQVLMNLAVNARDAMPRGGRLTIETGEVKLTPAAAALHPSGLPAGAYVALRVADTGHGMDEATLGRIFEPFFTTKAENGTGLGLSTVYGIVQQSGGRVWAESAPGRGATFHVWLPRAAGTGCPRDGAASPAAELPGGDETVLLVEDEDAVRQLAGRILRRHGYQVIDAAGGEQALRALAGHPGPIHLLLSDVVMPGMSGPDLAARLTADDPSLRVLFMSGYPGDALARHGVTGERLKLIPKPFTAERLVRCVRSVLDGAPVPVG